jgi:pyruvate/2-oxoglutarate dehydrogenase complex dihydrolipoamide acyltransferase (E2) component
MTNQLLTEAEALPDLDEYAGMSAIDIAQAVIYWPEGSEDQQRAIAALRQRAPGRGHNRPPLNEAIEEELAGSRARADQLLAVASRSVIVDEESAGKVVDLTRQLKELHDELDAGRLRKTKPYRDAQKMVNDHYHALQLKLTTAIGGTSGRDGLSRMLTQWDDKQRAAVEAERRRLAEEARKREEDAAAARAAAAAKAEAGRTDPAAELEAVRAADEAERLARRAEAIRHEPTRSQLGQTTRRRQIRFVIEDFNVRLRGILKSARRSQVEKLVADITEHELKDLGVAAVEAGGVNMPGVRAWVEEGGVNVRR